MKRSILIVDDNKMNRLTLVGILGGEYEVVEAENGAEALELLRENAERFSAVLLDLLMPGMDGYELLELLCADDALSRIPIIVATGAEDGEAELKSLSLGASDFITKPYRPQIVLRRLENAVKLHESAALANDTVYDRLTGLYTRETFFQLVEEAVAASEPGYYVLSCFDVDNFKMVNDQFGVAKGDDVLKQIAKVFTDGFKRVNGICCRITADKFAVLFPTSFLDSDELAEVHKNAARLDGSIRSLSYSIGRYIVDDPTLSISAMFDRASIAQASVKARFDLNIAVYDESMREAILREQEITQNMRTALEQGQFEPWFQPQYNHSSGALIGAEALVRWNHPDKGIIMPGEFIPLFERNGFIYEMDKSVWRRICELLRAWLDAGDEPLPISVNVSRYDVLRSDFFEVFTGLVEKYDIPPALLRIEITESAFAQSTERIIEVVLRLIDYGFTVEIDDFGSGYSSLNILKDVPANTLKLDMRFLETDGDTARGGNIIESIIRMAEWLGMPVIAEGVETKEQADYLRSIGCCYMQGYLFARPMPVEEYEKLAGVCGKEPELTALETAETLDNNAFWDPKSMETLIFNSYVGGACIFEYHNGKTELLRVNEKYARELGGGQLSIEEALRLKLSPYMDESNRAIMHGAIQKAVDTGEECSCEVTLKGLPWQSEAVYLRAALRVIARTDVRYLLYCSVINMNDVRRAERQVLQASTQLQAIVQNVNGGVSAAKMKDGRAEYIFASDLYYSMFGYTKRQFEDELEHGIIDIIHPDDLSAVAAANAESQQTGRPFSVEFRAFKRDGSIITVRTNGTICHIEGHDSPVQVAVLNDITGERESAKRILSAYEQLRFLNDMAHDLLAQTDAVSGIGGALEKVRGYFGADRAYIVELDKVSKLTDNTYEVCAEGVKSEMSNLQRLPYSAYSFWWTAFENDGYVGIEDVCALDDSREEERRILLSQGIKSLISVPLRRDGELIGFLCVDDPAENFENVDHLRAIGDYIAVMLTRRDLNARIDSDNKMMRALMDDTPGGFVRLKLLDGRTSVPVFVNSGFCKLVGMTSEQILESYKETAMWGVHPDDMDVVRAAENEMITKGETHSDKFRLRHGDGSYVWLMFFGRMTTDDAGDVYFNIYYTDISEREQKQLNFRNTLTVALEAMMASSSEHYFIKDKDLNYICCSRALAQAAGIEDEKDVAGKTDFDLFDAETAEKHRAADQKVIKSGRSLVDFLETLEAPDGSKRYTSTSKYLLHDSAGEVMGIYGIVRDITESHEAYTRLKLLTNSIPCGLAMYEISPREMKLMYFSDGYHALTGFTQQEYQKIAAKNPLGLIFEQDMPLVREQIKAVLAGAMSFEFTYRASSSDGGYRWLLMRGSVLERKGDTVLVNAVKLDITERMLAEEALRIREKEYALATDQSGRLIYRYFYDDNSIDIPPKTAQLFGLPRRIYNMPRGMLDRGVIDDESAQAYIEFFEALKRGEKTGSMTIRRSIADGSRRWYNARFSAVFDDEGKPVSALIVAEDITDNLNEHIVEALERTRLMSALRMIYPVAVSVNLTHGSYQTITGSEQLYIPEGSRGVFNDLIRSRAERLPPEYADEYLSKFEAEPLLRSLKKTGDSVRMQYRQRTGDGEVHWLETLALRVQNDYDNDAMGILVCRIIDEQKETEYKLRLAEMDGMTGLYNRTATEKLIKQRISLADGTPCALLIADLDNLKVINDALGHICGDDAIKLMTRIFNSQFRASDIVGRVGGDEFVAFIEGGNEARLRSLMTAFMRKLTAVRIGDKKDVALRGSVGIATGRLGLETYEELFDRADRALYHVKRNGKDDFAFYTPEMESATYEYRGHRDASVWQTSYFDSEELEHLLKAVAAVYPMVISVNLTQNSYYMMNYEDYTAPNLMNAGVFDDLIEQGVLTFHPDDRTSFLNAFARENLLAAHERGETKVSHTGRQLADDGEYHFVRTDVIFAVSKSTGDILEITLAREVNPE